MPNGYSNDLRDRVLQYYDEGHTQVETGGVFAINRATLCNWLKLRRETGSAHWCARPKQCRTRKIDEPALKAYIQAHPDAYLHEIGAEFGVSGTAILYACRRDGITRKKDHPLPGTR